MLSEWDPDSNSHRYLCNYYLGQGFFQELLQSLGDENFGITLRELYRLSLVEQKLDRLPGLAEVRQAFGDQANIIDKHWSGGLNAPENRPFDEGLERESHDLIRWDQLPTYDGRSIAFEGVLLGDAVLSQVKAGGGYQNFMLYSADGYEYLGSVLPPLSGNRSWTLDDPGDVVASKYLFYPATQTFTVEFPFPKGLDSPQDCAVIVWGFQDTSRTPSISEKVDILGYARIRVPLNQQGVEK